IGNRAICVEGDCEREHYSLNDERGFRVSARRFPTEHERRPRIGHHRERASAAMNCHHFTCALGVVPLIPAPTRSSIPLVFSPATAASLLLEEVLDVPVSAQPLSSQIAAAITAKIDKYFISRAKPIQLRTFRHQKSLRPAGLPRLVNSGTFRGESG